MIEKISNEILNNVYTYLDNEYKYIPNEKIFKKQRKIIDESNILISIYNFAKSADAQFAFEDAAQLLSMYKDSYEQRQNANATNNADDEFRNSSTSEDIEKIVKDIGRQKHDRRWVSRDIPVIDVYNPNERGMYNTGFKVIGRDAIIEYIELTMNSPDTKFKYRADIKKHAVLWFEEELQNKQIEQLREKIKYNKECESKVEEFFTEVWEIYRPSFIEYGDKQYTSKELFKAIIKHIIWEIKRRGIFLNEDIQTDVLVCLTGMGGNGKTRFIENLIKDIVPYSKFLPTCTLKNLTDQFGYNFWGEPWVGALNEMIKDNQAQVDELKTRMSSNYINARKMHGDDPQLFFKRVTLIGTCNEPIYTALRDKTQGGYRRYIDVKFTRGEIKSKTNITNALDNLFSKYRLDLWRSVDENLVNGYINEKTVDILAKVQKAQEFYVSSNDTVMQCLKANTHYVTSDNPGEKWTREEYFNEYYKPFCDEKKITPLEQKTFNQYIHRLYPKIKCASRLRIAKGDVSKNVKRELLSYFDLLDDIEDKYETETHDDDLDISEL